MNLRYAKEDEIDNIKEIWNYCFNDTEEFVNYYFNSKYENRNTIDIRAKIKIISGKSFRLKKVINATKRVSVQPFIMKELFAIRVIQL